MTGIGLRATDFPFLCNLLRTCGVAEPKLTFYKGNKVSKRYNASYNGNVRWYMHNRPLVEARSSLGLPSSRLKILQCFLLAENTMIGYAYNSSREIFHQYLHNKFEGKHLLVLAHLNLYAVNAILQWSRYIRLFFFGVPENHNPEACVCIEPLKKTTDIDSTIIQVQLRCELCGDDNQQTFPSQSRLETHMCDVHGRDKKFPCPKVNCQNSFKTKRPLYQHVTTSHARFRSSHHCNA
ncbi:C2H2-type zinc finger transcription factor [Mucor lusitanicus]|uniref:C2H2-type zinc finger transcription factor n=1 Tax=Mucor lusitanicus CBS 277.49 TaxID=747725 RepID=A0A162YJI1_MUCCL|nr:C2H2-type zinc finger transcription factor [Mucor lusitanicus CBS 277.49]